VKGFSDNGYESSLKVIKTGERAIIPVTIQRGRPTAHGSDLFFNSLMKKILAINDTTMRMAKKKLPLSLEVKPGP
jgi:hypothetical protein